MKDLLLAPFSSEAFKADFLTLAHLDSPQLVA